MATNAENISARDTNVITAAWRLIAREGVLALTDVSQSGVPQRNGYAAVFYGCQ